jgi:hypothetical protein
MLHSATARLSLLSLLFLAGCGGGGGGGGGVITTAPPTGPTPFTAQAGIAHAAAGAGTVRVDFIAPVVGFEVAVFVSTNANTLFASTPRVPAANETWATVGGLANGLVHFLGLGIRPTGGGAYSRIGAVATATPGAPIFVDVVSPSGGDGSTPALAFNSLLTALAAARTAGGGNVWVKGGTYGTNQSLVVVAGVHVMGGFGAAFDLATRAPALSPTIVNIPGAVDGLKLGDKLGNSLSVIVDGIRLAGNRRGRVGIDVDSTDPCDIELRGVIVTDMLDRGIRVRNANDNEFEIMLLSTQSSRNGADGLSGSGAWDYSVYNSLFGENGQEGFELDGLVPQTGSKVTLKIESSQFFSNGAEGLDCSMATPLVPTSGTYTVRIRGSAFERNALSGCVIDADFEAAPGYSAKVVLRESLARGNGGSGFHLDLDGPLDLNDELSAFVHRVLATGNAGDGLRVTSESRPGLLAVSTSAMVGNAGSGLRAEGPVASAGNRAIAVTHCLFAGNLGGGMISRDISASGTSSIAYLQGSAFDANTTEAGNVSTTSFAAIAFVNAATEYSHVISRSGGVLTLSAPCGFTTSAVLELADDTALRAITSITGGATVVTLMEVPDDFSAPGFISAFQPGTTDVVEDYMLAGGSIALAAGLNAADAGLFGSAAPGRPGVADEEAGDIFYAQSNSPEISETVGAGDTLTIGFSGTVNGASANATTVRAFRGATSIPVTLSTAGPRLMIDPIGGNWGAGDFRVELDGLTDAGGIPLSGALVLPFSR